MTDTDFDDLVASLRVLSRAHASLVAEANSVAAQRDRMIVVLHRTGMSMRELGHVTGLHPTRISQIVREVDLDLDTDIPPV